MSEQKLKIKNVELIDDLTAESVNGGGFTLTNHVRTRYFPFLQHNTVEFKINDLVSKRTIKDSLGGDLWRGDKKYYDIEYGTITIDSDIGEPGFQSKTYNIDTRGGYFRIARTGGNKVDLFFEGY